MTVKQAVGEPGTMTAPVPVPGGFGESEMNHILKRACEAIDLDSSNPRLLRGHTNAVILVGAGTEQVVVKIARRGSRVTDVTRTVQFVRWLMDADFPTVPLHPASQPVIVDQQAVTFWTYLPQPSALVAAHQLAKPLYALHTLGIPDLLLPHHDNIRAIRRSISAITSLPFSTLQFLTDRTDRLEAELENVDFTLPKNVIQGDPQHRNALHTKDGATVLCDWDTVAIGQPEWDLVTVEVHCRRFGYGLQHYQSFSDSYGYDVTHWHGYSTLVDIRELRMITTNARKTRHAPGSLAEVERRIDGLRHEDRHLQWRIL